jgi:hypothetical protein
MDAKRLLPAAIGVGLVGGFVWSEVPPAVTMSDAERSQIEQSVWYAGCNEVRNAGRGPLYAGQPGNREGMDGDGDGIACEPIRN